MKQQKDKRKTSAAKAPLIPWYQREVFHYFALVCGTLLLYSWTTSFGYSLDDDYVVSYFSNVGNDWSGLQYIFRSWFGGSDYRPVTLLSFWMERQLFGSLSASHSHLVNVILFAFVLILVYRFIVASGFYTDKHKLKFLALLTGLFFLVHPNHVSVVANIKSRDNLLSMLFGLMAARQLLLAYDLKQYMRLLLFIVFIVLGLLAKRDSYAFIVVPALIIIMFRHVNIKMAAAITVSAFTLYVLAFWLYGIFHALPDNTLVQFSMRPSENPLAYGGTFSERLSQALTSLGYYLKFLFIPTGYHFYFGYDQIPLQPLFSFQNIFVFFAMLILSGMTLSRFQLDRIYLFCLIAFLLSIAYALNFYTQVAGIVMDRYNFIPSLFFCTALAALFLSGTPTLSRRTVLLSITVLLIVYSGFTLYRTSAWKNHYTLFDRDLPHLERSANAYRLAGGTYIHTALIEEMKPGHNRQLTDSFIQKGERYTLHSLSIYDRSPQAWELAGLCDLYRKNDSAALHKFQRSFYIDSTYYSSINYIGFSYWNLLKLDSAIYYFSYVMDREPVFNYSANNLVNLYLKNNRRTEADSVLQLLYRRFPGDRQLSRKLQEVYGSPFPPLK